jgi:CheY-like chemotaxis protein
MDHMMPEMDGIEAARIIRNEINTDYARSVPIIVLTANALAGNEDMFLRSGFDAFVSKPIDIQILDSVLNQFIRDKQSKDTLEKARDEAKKLEAENRAASQNESMKPLFIEGIDVEAGIERYADKEVFMELLDSYMRHTPLLLQKLKALSPRTLGDYAIAAHGLKGASYGILAAEVGKRAEELEALSKAGDYEQTLERNDDFVRDVEYLVRGIEAALKAFMPSAPKAQKDSIPLETLKIIFDAAAHFKTVELEKTVDELVKYEYADQAHTELALWLSEQTENLEYGAICERLKSEGI